MILFQMEWSSDEEKTAYTGLPALLICRARRRLLHQRGNLRRPGEGAGPAICSPDGLVGRVARRERGFRRADIAAPSPPSCSPSHSPWTTPSPSPPPSCPSISPLSWTSPRRQITPPPRPTKTDTNRSAKPVEKLRQPELSVHPDHAQRGSRFLNVREQLTELTHGRDEMLVMMR